MEKIKEVYEENILDKLQFLLQRHYNLFHADMIMRAIFDNDVSFSDFSDGEYKINVSERMTDDDEFTPEEFANV